MNINVDRTYRFVWDSEPTDEQRLVIMQKVGEEVGLGNEQTAQQLIITPHGFSGVPYPQFS